MMLNLMVACLADLTDCLLALLDWQEFMEFESRQVKMNNKGQSVSTTDGLRSPTS